ncbi:MAG: peptidylprolyl isomerase [Sorangium cellulosum]|nr:MAG: peptidylprolyl isomerase [Sorangium cellulosum]
MPRIFPLLCATVVLASMLTTSVRPASATVVERVVAVIGERAILMSDLRKRARPFLVEINAKAPTEAQKAAAQSQLLRQLLERMIDDQLAAQTASKLRVRIESEEIDKAIARLARSQEITVAQLMAEVLRSGMTAQEYRSEIRRQLLEGRLLELRVKGQVRVTEEDMRAMYSRLQREERRTLGFKPQWIVLRIPPDANAQTISQQRHLADQLVGRLRAGEDFDTLAKKYSDDAATGPTGGHLGPRRPGELDVPIERIAASLEVGEISAPFRYADAFVIMRIVQRDPSKFGTFEQARNQLAQRVYAEKLQLAKRRWLDNLKRGVHIDIRL